MTSRPSPERREGGCWYPVLGADGAPTWTWVADGPVPVPALRRRRRWPWFVLAVVVTVVSWVVSPSAGVVATFPLVIAAAALHAYRTPKRRPVSDLVRADDTSTGGNIGETSFAHIIGLTAGGGGFG